MEYSKLYQAEDDVKTRSPLDLTLRTKFLRLNP